MSPASYGMAGISPIGIGLMPSAYGDYSNYMPSSMMDGTYGGGLMNSVFGNGYGAGTTGMMGMMGMPGMSGMMNMWADYQKYMTDIQNQIQQNQIDHAGVMHNKMVDYQVNTHKDALSGMMETMLADSAIQQRVYSLHEKLVEKDQRGACQEYDKLKERVYATYSEEMKKHGCSIGRADDANQWIEKVYGNLISAATGTEHSLRGDIDKYCDGAFGTGFWEGFKGETNQKYRSETENHIFGKRIDNRRGKNTQETVGKGLGMFTSAFKDVGAGSLLGAGVYISGISLGAFVNLLAGGKASWYKDAVKKGTGWAALAGIGALVAADVIKRISNKESASE